MTEDEKGSDQIRAASDIQTVLSLTWSRSGSGILCSMSLDRPFVPSD